MLFDFFLTVLLSIIGIVIGVSIISSSEHLTSTFNHVLDKF